MPFLPALDRNNLASDIQPSLIALSDVMRDSPDDTVPAKHGNPVSSSGSSGARSFLTPDRGDVAPNADHAPALPSTVPILTGVTEPSAPPLPADGSSTSRITHHGSSSAQERVNSNHIVETQLTYISNGPFSEELKQKLTQEVLLYATLDNTRSNGGSPLPGAAVTDVPSHADDIRFCNEIETALKISENTRQPNDPNVQPPVGQRQPIWHLIEACQHKPALQAKLQMLRPYFSHYRPVIGDGNCFYRSFAFGMVECSMIGGLPHLEQCKDKVKACTVHARQWLATLSRSEIPGNASFKDRSEKLLTQGYYSFRAMFGMILKAVREQLDPLDICLDVFQMLSCRKAGTIQRDEMVQGVQGSSIMHLIRQLTAYEMLTHEEDYATFLPAIEGWWRTHVPQDDLSVPLVVGHLVVVDGVEAEHVMIQAVSTLLGICLAVVYADGQANPQVHIIGPTRDHHNMDRPRLFLLFRDGHYDLVYPVSDSWRCLVAQADDSCYNQQRTHEAKQ